MPSPRGAGSANSSSRYSTQVWQLPRFPVSTLRHWEGNRGMPGLPVLLRLAETLGVPLERLAEGMEDPAGEG